MRPRARTIGVHGILLLALVVLAGCESGEFTHYISPQISGRVLAADTRQPLAGVTVARVGSHHESNSFWPAKGGQVLVRPSGARTDADGRFVLEGVTVFAVIRQPTWWSVPVVFERSGYASFQTNFTGTNVIGRAASGAPKVDAGEVLLTPNAR